MCWMPHSSTPLAEKVLPSFKKSPALRRKRRTVSHIDPRWMDGATGAERFCVISWMCPHPTSTPTPNPNPNPTASVVTALRFVLLVAALTHCAEQRPLSLSLPPSLSVLAITSEIWREWPLPPPTPQCSLVLCPADLSYGPELGLSAGEWMAFVVCTAKVNCGVQKLFMGNNFIY